MSGLSDYAQNQQEPVTVNSYTEVDALTLASLSYIQFEKVYPDYQDRTVSLQQFAKDALASGIPLSDNERELLNQIQNSPRYEQCTVSNMAAENQTSQWAAMTISLNDGSNTDVIAMRSTNGTTLGWTEDLELGYKSGDGTEAQRLARDYLNNSRSENLLLAGHSKGGNDVVSAYVMAEESVRNRVLHIDNFDGPGVNDEFRDRYMEGYRELDGKLDNYYPQDSIVGQLLNDNPGRHHYIHSDGSNFLDEHDPYTWMLDEEGAGWQGDQQSGFSEMLNSVTDGALAGMTQLERAILIRTLIHLQIPNLIAQDGSFLAASRQGVDRLLQELFEKGILTQEQVEQYGEILKTVAGIAEAFVMIATMTPIQLKVLLRTISAMVLQLVVRKAVETVEKALDKLKEAYLFVAKVIENKLREVAEQIRNFVDNMQEQIGVWCDKIREWFSRWGKRRVGSAGGAAASFETNVPALLALANDLNAQEKLLKACAQQIRRVAGTVTWQVNVRAGWQISSLAKNVEEEARACGKLHTALEKTGRRYERTEKQLLAAAGG